MNYVTLSFTGCISQLAIVNTSPSSKLLSRARSKVTILGASSKPEPKVDCHQKGQAEHSEYGPL